MQIIDQSWKWLQKPENPLQLIEQAGRTCYRFTDTSAETFVRMLIKSGHHSVLEHVSASIEIETNRGVTHELVRHRTGIAFSQESTRYCDYGGQEMRFIRPVWMQGDTAAYEWQCAMIYAENNYKQLRSLGWRPEQARDVLPNALASKIVMTANLREWRHVFSLRTSPKAHPQMRALMLDIQSGFREAIPVMFDE